MKAVVSIEQDNEGFFAQISFIHDFIDIQCNDIASVTQKSKGELKRKVIQFGAALNLDVEFI
jgi:hypothetical protein